MREEQEAEVLYLDTRKFNYIKFWAALMLMGIAVVGILSVISEIPKTVFEVMGADRDVIDVYIPGNKYGK